MICWSSLKAQGEPAANFRGSDSNCGPDHCIAETRGLQKHSLWSRQTLGGPVYIPTVSK